MGITENGNWIGAERRPARDGNRFVLRSAGRGDQPLGSWPRSRTRDILDALARAEECDAWAGTTPDERYEVVARALDLLTEDPDPEGISSRATGLRVGELKAHLDGLWARLEQAGEEDPWRGSRGPILCAPHWSELFSGFAESVLALEDGHSVCFLSSAPIPALVDRLAWALRAAGLPSGAFNVLHDDGSGALRCASEMAAYGPFGGFFLSAPVEPPAIEARKGAGRIHAPKAYPFGAGVDPAPERVPPLRRRFRSIARGRAEVGPDEDLEAAADRVFEGALGRGVLGGQLSGQTGLVTCHPRVFSGFTEALLARLDDPDRAPNGLYRDPEVASELVRARELGLDEGATLIGESGAWAGGSSPSESAGGSLGWLVFTNVEPTMRLAGLTRPTPMLLLMRGEV